jgi:N-acyl-D-amino-acid deacylase
MYDLVIGNGRILTGLGSPWFWGDLAVLKGKIVKVGRLSGAEAGKSIDAGGRLVTPGFIDGHSHADVYLFENPEMEPKVMQGVTTENVGMDGLSVAPINKRDVKDWRKFLSGLAGDPNMEWSWGSLGDYFDNIDASKPSLNISSYVGLGTIRMMVMGMTDREATTREIEQMKRIAAQAMADGARGVSSGLIYPPCQYQRRQEIIELAKIAGEHNGIFDVHMRNEGDHVMEAIEEVTEIGRKARIPVLITHFKVMGKNNWGLSEKTLQMVDRAREEGVEVTVAQYPYTAGSTMLQAIIPPRYHTAGPERLLAALRKDKESVKGDIYKKGDWENLVAYVGWENILVSSVESEENKDCEGRSIKEIATMRGLRDPADAALGLLAEEELGVGMVIFGMSEEDVVRIMKHPTVSFITDGILGGRKPHPRAYGSYPRILGKYVRDEGVLGIEEAVRKMTSLPAEKLRLRTKGVIAENYDADLVIFDPEKIRDKATFQNPRQFPGGVEWVIVNGQIVVQNGKHTGARPGRAIRTR